MLNITYTDQVLLMLWLISVSRLIIQKMPQSWQNMLINKISDHQSKRRQSLTAHIIPEKLLIKLLFRYQKICNELQYYYKRINVLHFK